MKKHQDKSGVLKNPVCPKNFGFQDQASTDCQANRQKYLGYIQYIYIYPKIYIFLNRKKVVQKKILYSKNKILFSIKRFFCFQNFYKIFCFQKKSFDFKKTFLYSKKNFFSKNNLFFSKILKTFNEIMHKFRTPDNR
jgi:hypothetical protein